MSAFENGNRSPVDPSQLAVQAAKLDISGKSWLEHPTKLYQVKTMKETCLSNCRLLYGSERFKFYDVVICEDEKTMSFAAILTCNQENETKFLRIEPSGCPVEAVRALVHGLQKDTAKLFTKYSAGSQIRGQQGSTNMVTGEYELWSSAHDTRVPGSNDDTDGLIRHGPAYSSRLPRGPRGDTVYGRDRKRARGFDQPSGERLEKTDGESTALNYD